MDHKYCLAILGGEFFMGFTRYRSFMGFTFILIGITIGLALSPVFKLFKGSKNAVK